MGFGHPDSPAFLSAPQSLRTGILPPSAATVIDTVGTRRVTLLPLAGRTGLRAAEVVDPNTGVTYYVEHRFPTGRDLLNGLQMKTGVRVLRFTPVIGTTALLDPSPKLPLKAWCDVGAGPPPLLHVALTSCRHRMRPGRSS